MKKVNFKFTFVGLDGKPRKEVKPNELIAEELGRGNSGKPVRASELARKIFQHGTVELLSEDETMIRETITKSDRLTDLLKGQALEVMNNAKSITR